MVPKRVQQAMDRDSVDVGGQELIDLNNKITGDLLETAKTKQHVARYVGNGHAAWEAAIVNALSDGDKALIVDSGFFAQHWKTLIEEVGVHIDLVPPKDQDHTLDTDALTKKLREDAKHEIKAVLCCQVDTMTGVLTSVPALRACLDAANHPALLMVDCIASLCCAEFEMDKWGVDVCVAGSQKGYMMPVGLSFNFVSDKALAVRKQKTKVPPFLDWVRRVENKFGAWFGTGPSTQVYGLATSLDMIIREAGLEMTWARHQIFAEAVWAAVDTWAKAGALEPRIKPRANRSPTVTVVRLPGRSGADFRKWILEECNLLLSGHPDKDCFRIGHMGHMNPPMLLGMLGTIETGLKALDIPHGEGALPAAMEVIANGWKKLAAEGGTEPTSRL